MYGAFYPVGGAPAIAKCLLNTGKCGRLTRVRASVDEILIERGRAVGVRMAGGEEIGETRGLQQGIMSTVDRLLPASARGIV